ncbi:MAG: type II secretion system protein [Candidatus Pacebacteria bacterium]|nr:type II secretion system protein [Candidatus Paceibacterota bacterium]
MINTKRGFSLLELLIVVAILAIIGAAGAGSYRGFFKNVDVQSASRTIVSNLNLMVARAMAGEGGLKWGVHFVSGTADSYYELFSTPTTYGDAGKEIVETDYLPKSIIFSDPSPGNTKDIIFDRITGTTTASSITITSEGLTQTINVTAIGTVY